MKQIKMKITETKGGKTILVYGENVMKWEKIRKHKKNKKYKREN